MRTHLCIMALRSRSAAELRLAPVCAAMPVNAQRECERLRAGVAAPDETAELVDTPTVGTALEERALKGNRGGRRDAGCWASDDAAAGGAAGWAVSRRCCAELLGRAAGERGERGDDVETALLSCAWWC